MSAFVISRETMDRCVGAIFHERYGSYTVRSFCGKSLEEWDKSELGRFLYAVNTSAVAERYNEEPQYMGDYSFRPYVASTLIAGVKALHCLIYQCGEGDIPETQPYKELERIAGELCRDIVRDLPAYEAAPR